jgi:hypothetical protein
MKLFLIKTVLFGLLLFAGAFVLDCMIGHGLKKSESADYVVWNDIIHSNINADVIMSGSSRSWVHISPKIIDSILSVNSYNIGIDGYPFNLQYARYQLYKKYNKDPELIIQIADATTLHVRKDAFEKLQFLPYMHEPLLHDALKEIGFSIFDLYFPAIQYYADLNTIKTGLEELFNIRHEQSQLYKGYQGMVQKWDGRALEKILQSGDSIKACMDSSMIALMDSFLHHCKQKNIQVILVFPPEYYKAIDYTADLQKLKNIYASFSKKYNYPFLDYSRDSLCYDTLYFYNAMHLNKQGAELFSIKLAHDIIKYRDY